MKNLQLRLYISVLLFLVVFTPEISSQEYEIKWEKVYGSEESETVQIGFQLSDGSIIMAGPKFQSGKIYVVKLDSVGELIWENEYDALWLNEMIEAKDGNLYLAEYGNDFSIIKINSEGEKEWTKSFGGSEEDIIFSVVENELGFLLAGKSKSNDGEVSGNNGEFDAWVVQVDYSVFQNLENY